MTCDANDMLASAKQPFGHTPRNWGAARISTRALQT